MINPKKFTLLLFAILISAFMYAQTIFVKKETEHTKGEKTDGYSVELNGALNDVTTSLIKYLKTFGKTKNLDRITLSDWTINGKTYPYLIYASTREKGNAIQAYLGIKSGEWPSGDAENFTSQLEKTVYDFGVQYYRGKVQLQIDESNQALQAVERQQQRLTNQNRDLNVKLEVNKREKIQLEKSIVNNQLELETLTKKIEKNKKDQDSVLIANEQIKKVIEMQKEKQRKIN